MTKTRRITWGSVALAAAFFSGFLIKDDIRYLVGSFATLCLGMVIARRGGTAKNSLVRSSSPLGKAINAYLMMAVALGLGTAGLNIIFSPGQLHPRLMQLVGGLLAAAAVTLVGYAVHLLRARQAKIE